MAFRSSRADTFSGLTGAVTVVVPTGMSVGDVVVGVQSADSGGFGNLPSSWTVPAVSQQSSSVDGQTSVYGYRYEPTTVPANYSWTLAGAVEIVISQACFRGGTGAINADAGENSGGVAQLGSSISIPSVPLSVTTTKTCDLLFIAMPDWAVPVTAPLTQTTPTGFTQRDHTVSTPNGYASVGLYTKDNQPSGTYGSGISTTASQQSSSTAGDMAYLVAIENAGSSGIKVFYLKA